MSKSVLRIGIAGLGNVGAALVGLVQAQDRLRLPGRLEIVGVSARSRVRQRGVDISGYCWFDDPVELAGSEIDILVELIGGADGPALRATEAALAGGKHVVTANKAMLSLHASELAALAERHDRALLFEAAVAGAVPIIRSLREGLGGVVPYRIAGILNGTSNYVLSQMRQSRQSYADCLAEAQRLGYAESDPSLDISGMDSAHKLALLAGIAFSARPALDRVGVEGIEHIAMQDIALADQFGFRIKLVALALRSDQGVICRVEPVLVAPDHPLFGVEDALNAVVLETEIAGRLGFSGAGAGADPTASAVIGDISRLFHGSAGAVFGTPASMLEDSLRLASDDEAAWFLRTCLTDRSGALASLSDMLANSGLSIDVMHQDSAGASGEATIAIITHPCSRQTALAAKKAIMALPSCIGSPCLLRLDNM